MGALHTVVPTAGSGPPSVSQPAPGPPPLGALVERLADRLRLGHFEAGSALAVAGAAQPCVLAALATAAGRRTILAVTATSADAERLVADLQCFLEPDGVALFPPWDTLPLERVSPDVATMGQRLEVLWRLLGPEKGPAVVVAPVRAVLQRLGVTKEAAEPLVIASGSEVDPSAVVERLSALGYRREHQVEHRGELAVRGGIVDVFPSTAQLPVRLDFFGDEIERLSVFDVGDQRSLASLEETKVFGCREVRPTDALRARARALVHEAPWAAEVWERLAAGELFEGMESWLPWLAPKEELITDHLEPGSLVALVEPRRLRDRAIGLADEEAALVEALATTWGLTDPAAVPRLHASFDRLLARSGAPALSLVSVAEGPSTPALRVAGFERIASDPAALAAEVRRLRQSISSVTLCAGVPETASRLLEALVAQGVEATVAEEASLQPGTRVVTAPLGQGFSLPELDVAVLAESDVTGRRVPHRRPRPRARPTDGFFDDLAPGGFVVHRQHGIARYAGMTTRTVAGTTRDYLVLEFRGQDRLYLPTDQLAAITPYSGGETPSLSRMNGSEWQRTRSRAKAAAAEVAEELVNLYRLRRSITGHAFSPDTPFQHELEGTFPYTETAGQLKAIEEVKADMEEPRPMDRLVCGDVGFGKTEVAVRAAFKAVQDGKQAAVLVPTTLLASQHLATFSERYVHHGVNVAMLSRFLTSSETRQVLAGLVDGSIDVVIGTHRLLASDVAFKDLGLLVIDEEQRFGVAHKEAIQKISSGVDVLTLTASPIPRTLEMAFTGIRDLSLIDTPPADRRRIHTYVGEYDEQAVCEALRRELLRDGQVFFVHNRVMDIEAVADRLRQLVPEAKVAVAHGQMDEGSLEQVALEFWDHKHDILVCTTIIESGIDMPQVNTLVVDRADLLGLGQLHQLRGRVGRSAQRAYAYLFYPQDRVLTEAAYERLKTVGEETELGSGFKIAMRDLEIRGAGNILGSDQSGHIAAVGYDLYVQLVAEAVAEAKGEAIPEVPTVSLDVPGDAHLPADYVPGEDTRIEAYRRIAAATTPSDVDDVVAEWRDRFGRLPPAAEGLVTLARLRVAALAAQVTDIVVRRASAKGRLQAKVSPLRLAPSAQARLHRLAPQATYREELAQLIVPLSGQEAPAAELAALLGELGPREGGDRGADRMTPS